MNLIEITNAYDTAEQAYIDWSVLDLPEVQSAVKRAAWRFADDYLHVVEREDMEQELSIAFAERARMVREVIATQASPGGVLAHRGYAMLRDRYITEAKYKRLTRSYEVLTGGGA
ncbi:hypothetical protein phiHau3_46 [Streptomyces phage phiHau3]|uniref:Uncharacterized protein n=1 Tax=Streptomyces phage phiHau3 TaxID=1204524 RepID=K4HYM6_9CAUD|nr:hypothetical protein phiHau3_46 [Streptomyces phage phiHau3]AFU62023.1 hypothetical protein phiHau3_46 [Streptomyces phage phiHau3]